MTAPRTAGTIDLVRSSSATSLAARAFVSLLLATSLEACERMPLPEEPPSFAPVQIVFPPENVFFGQSGLEAVEGLVRLRVPFAIHESEPWGEPGDEQDLARSFRAVRVADGSELPIAASVLVRPDATNGHEGLFELLVPAASPGAYVVALEPRSGPRRMLELATPDGFHAWRTPLRDRHLHRTVVFNVGPCPHITWVEGVVEGEERLLELRFGLSEPLDRTALQRGLSVLIGGTTPGHRVETREEADSAYSSGSAPYFALVFDHPVGPADGALSVALSPQDEVALAGAFYEALSCAPGPFELGADFWIATEERSWFGTEMAEEIVAPSKR